MRQDELQMRIAAWLLFTVSLTAATLETQRDYRTHLGTLRGALGEARSVASTVEPIGPPVVDARRSAPAPLPSRRRPEVDRHVLNRGDAMLLVLLMAGGSRPLLR